MRYYKVLFVVTARSAEDALHQAEGYLNTGDRCIDCDVVAPVSKEKRIDPGPVPAPRLRT